MGKKRLADEMENEQIVLRYHDISKIYEYSISTVFAQRGAGKSNFIKNHIKENLYRVGTFVVFNGTESLNHSYNEMGVAPIFIYNYVNDEIMTKMCERQEKRANKAKRDPSINPTLMMIFDDMMAFKKAMATDQMRNMFLNGRHYKLMVVIAVQYIKDLPTSMRDNIDYVYALKTTKRPARKRLYEEFFSQFSSLKVFEAALDFYTDEHGVLVLDNKAPGSKPEDIYFYYKPKYITERLKLGSEEVWEFNEQFYNGLDDTGAKEYPDEGDEDESDDETLDLTDQLEQKPLRAVATMFAKADKSGNIIHEKALR